MSRSAWVESAPAYIGDNLKGGILPEDIADARYSSQPSSLPF